MEILEYSQTTVNKYIQENNLREKRKGKIDIEKLKKLFAQNPPLTNRQIAEEFGVTRGTIASAKVLWRRGELGVKKERKEVNTKTDAKGIIEYRKAHPEATVKGIAKIFGNATDTVRRILRKEHLQQGHKPQAKVDKQRLLSLIEENKDITLRQLADEFGASISAVIQNMTRLGLKFREIRSHRSSIEEFAKFVKEHPEMQREDIEKHFGKAKSTIANYVSEARNLGLLERKKKKHEEKN